MRFRYLKYWFLGLALFIAHAPKALCQDKDIPKELYVAASIPDSLKENANAVVRYSRDEIMVKAAGKAVIKHHDIVTILNEKGDDNAEFIFGYNRKWNGFSTVEFRVYNAMGKQLKKYSKSDMYDRSAVDDETIISDERLLALKHTVSAYPTTIETIYEDDLSSFINLNTWYLQPDPEVAVQNSTCVVVVNSSLGFRYNLKNTNLMPEKDSVNNFARYTWQVKNLRANKPEKKILRWQSEQKISFATNSFEFFGIPGSLDSWQHFGKWVSALNADVCTLSPERAAEIKKMTDTIKTDKDKARFLYKYMQQNVRYVSIQLGIGGLKPFPATFVDQKKYGDCKALSNYMFALLKAVNIPANYAFIRAGDNEEPADPKFPFDSFNHAILCIPFKGDTTWLECTNNTAVFGKLGSFTENRNALLITDDGGKLVNTPKSTMQDNQFNSNVHMVLNADGGAKAQVQFLTTGGYRDSYIGRASEKLDEQKENWIRSLNIKQPSRFELKNSNDKDEVKKVEMELEYDKFCDVMAGTRQFYRPRVFDLWTITLPEAEKRKNDYYFEHPMQKQCVTTIDLPEGFEVESLPASVSLKFSYGDYQADYKYDAAKNQVVSTVKFKLLTQAIPAAKYTEMQVYFDDIAKAQNKKLVIKRKA